jgi:hypothetical protein
MVSFSFFSAFYFLFLFFALPFQQSTSPGKSSAKTGHNDLIAPIQLPLPVQFI